MRLFKKIKCMRHLLVKPGKSPWVMERIPSLKNIKEGDARIFGIKLYRAKRDKYGRKIPNWDNYYHPEISAAEARERIFDPKSIICNNCKACVIG